MKHLLRPALGAVLVLVVAACADPSGQPWTPPPAGTPAAETTAPASQAPASAAPESAAPASAAPESAAPTAAPASSAPSAAPSIPVPSGPIALTFTADGQLQRDGAQVTDIAVTPGETAEFVVTNESGQPHSFYIGPSGSFLLGLTADLVGIPEWSDAEPKSFSWEVPADIATFKFGSTVGSDFNTMSGTFSVAGAATPAPASQAPATGVPASPAASVPATSADPGGRVIELELDGALQIKENGVKVTNIPVTPGETIVFKLHNTAGYAHNFWIGPDQALMTNQTQGLTGVPDWSDGEIHELTWVVPDDAASLKFGCTVPGHYSLMNGTFSIAA